MESDPIEVYLIFQDVLFIGKEYAGEDEEDSSDQEKHEDGCTCRTGLEAEKQERETPGRWAGQQRL